MNPFQHAIETRRIALKDNGLLAWVKHNQDAIMSSLQTCNRLEDVKTHGITPIYDHQVDTPTIGFLQTWVDE